jgi:hypothetical protein
LFNIISQGGSIKNFKEYVDFITIKRRPLWKNCLFFWFYLLFFLHFHLKKFQHKK